MKKIITGLSLLLTSFLIIKAQNDIIFQETFDDGDNNHNGPSGNFTGWSAEPTVDYDEYNDRITIDNGYLELQTERHFKSGLSDDEDTLHFANINISGYNTLDSFVFDMNSWEETTSFLKAEYRDVGDPIPHLVIRFDNTGPWYNIYPPYSELAAARQNWRTINCAIPDSLRDVSSYNELDIRISNETRTRHWIDNFTLKGEDGPVANFSVDSCHICTNGNVEFTDASIDRSGSAISSWDWDFGAGATPGTHNGETPPAIQYTTPGEKTITLTINSSLADEYTATKNYLIRVFDKPNEGGDTIFYEDFGYPIGGSWMKLDAAESSSNQESWSSWPSGNANDFGHWLSSDIFDLTTDPVEIHSRSWAESGGYKWDSYNGSQGNISHFYEYPLSDGNDWNLEAPGRNTVAELSPHASGGSFWRGTAAKPELNLLNIDISDFISIDTLYIGVLPYTTADATSLNDNNAIKSRPGIYASVDGGPEIDLITGENDKDYKWPNYKHWKWVPLEVRNLIGTGNTLDLRFVGYDAGYSQEFLIDDIMLKGARGSFVKASPLVQSLTPDIDTAIICGLGEEIKFYDGSRRVPIYTWDWDFGADASLAPQNSQGPFNVSYSSPGQKIVELTVNMGKTCVDIDTMIVQVCPYFDPGFIGADTTVCLSTPPEFIQTPATGGCNVTYQWQKTQSLIDNGGFEQDKAFWQGNTSSTTITTTKRHVYTGNKALFLDSAEIYSDQIINLSSSTNYKASVMIKVMSFDTIDFYIENFNGGSGSVKGSAMYNPRPGGDPKYKEYTVSFTTGANDTTARFRITGAEGPMKSTAFIDDIKIYPDGGSMWQDITDSTNATFTENNTLTSTWYYRRVATSEYCGTKYSNVKQVDVLTGTDPGEIDNADDGNTLCFNTAPANFTNVTVASGGGGVSYQWQSRPVSGGSWQDISGETGSGYSNPANLKISTLFRRAAIYTGGCQVEYSNTIRINVYDSLQAGDIGSDENICYNTTPSGFVSNTDASGGGTIEYQWQRNINSGGWTDVGGNSSTYNESANLTNNTLYRRRVESTTCGTTAYSDTITINVYNQMDGGDIDGDQSICYNSVPAAFTSPTPATGGGGINYQWQRKPLGSGSWTNIGSDSPTYTENVSLQQSTIYRRQATSTEGCGTVMSDTITVTVYADMDGGDIEAGQSICHNTDPAGFLSTTAASGGGGFTYQWKKKEGTGSWQDVGGNSATFDDPNNLTETTLYYREANSTEGCSFANSDTVTVTVYADLQAGSIGGTQSICYNSDPAGFTNSTAASGGGGFNYQWQISNAGAGSWANIAGATSAAYDTNNLQDSKDYRRRAISTQCGTVATAPITVTVYDDLDAGTIASDQNICYNTDPAAFSSTTAASGGGGVDYQWEKRVQGGSWNDISGATSETFDDNANLDDTTYYRRRAISQQTCGTATTGSVTVFVYGQLNGGQIGSDQVLNYNSVPAPFTNITAPGGGVSLLYQWQERAESAGSWSSISGATGLTYSETDSLTETTRYRRQVNSGGGCGTAYSNEITMLVFDKLNPGLIGNDTIICYNTTPATFINTFSIQADTTYNLQWQKSPDANNWTDIAGATDSLFTESTPITDTTYYRRRIVTITEDTAYTNDLMVDVYDPLDGGDIGSDQTICYNSNPTAFTNDVSASGGGSSTYQWRRKPASGNWSNIGGATNEIYSEPNDLVENYQYTRLAISSEGCGTASSDTITVSLYGQLDGGLIGSDQDICFNSDPDPFTNDASAAGGGGMTYVWQKKSLGAFDWDTLNSETNPTFDDSNQLVDTMLYRRLAISSQGCGTISSDTVQVNVYEQMDGGSVGNDQSICVNASPNAFTNNIAASGGGGINYQWQRLPQDSTTWINVPGANNIDFNESNGLVDTTYYRRAAVSTQGCGTVYSDTITVNVFGQLYGGQIGGDTNLCFNNQPAAFTNDSSAKGGGTITYQWQRRFITDPSFTDIVGAISETYTENNALTDTIQYRRLANSALCGSVSSDTITINVYDPMDGGDVGSDQNLCFNNAPAAFTNDQSARGGGALTYQWQRLPQDSTTWIDISGATSADFDEGNQLFETTYYRRQATSTEGCGSSLSDTITVVVYEPLDGGEIAGDTSISFNSDPEEFENVVSPSGGTGLTYQWQKSSSAPNNFTDILGANNLTFDEANDLQDTTYYRRVTTSAGGCGTAYSDTIRVSVIDSLIPGTIATYGNDNSICYNSTPDTLESGIIKPHVTTGFVYQWQKRSVDSINFSDIPGESGEKYLETNPLTTNTEYRRRIITVAGDTVYSDTLTIIVHDQMQGGDIDPAQNLCYATQPEAFYSVVDASGGGDSIIYQWELYEPDNSLAGWIAISPNGRDESYAENDRLTDTTWYRRRATSNDGCGPVYSDTLVINVYDTIDFDLIASDTNLTLGESAEISVQNETGGAGSPYNYTWYDFVAMDSSGFGSYFDVKDGGYYYVKIRDAENCVSGFRRIEINEKLEAPQAISPNGDGRNDEFVIRGLYKIEEEYSLIVFNKWGEKVFEASPYLNNWAAEGLPDGTYYYVLKSNKENEEILSDYLEVVRERPNK